MYISFFVEYIVLRGLAKFSNEKLVKVLGTEGFIFKCYTHGLFLNAFIEFCLSSNFHKLFSRNFWISLHVCFFRKHNCWIVILFFSFCRLKNRQSAKQSRLSFLYAPLVTPLRFFSCLVLVSFASSKYVDAKNSFDVNVSRSSVLYLPNTLHNPSKTFHYKSSFCKTITFILVFRHTKWWSCLRSIAIKKQCLITFHTFVPSITFNLQNLCKWVYQKLFLFDSYC